MLTRLVQEFDAFALHHQIITALSIISGIVFISWGLENILENYLFPHKPFYSYILMIVIGLFLLFLTQHFFLRLM